MANRINNRRYNKLLSYRNNYYMYGSQMQNDPYRLNGRYSTPAIVDGMGVGDVGNMVLRDRKNLAENGIITVVVAIDRRNKIITSGPDIVSRGFVYVRNSEELIDEVRSIVTNIAILTETMELFIIAESIKAKDTEATINNI